ncbi:tRNA 2-thiouridine synthesizing protein B [Pseudomonas oryzihabitans]|uniref:Sulfurtransferase complex subunit TusB n=1 Tax=Pseudomonas flavocrustae TaxID=2991719 RepID=A0ABT6IE43_9PSED|nr:MULTISPECIES: sulfurtransferase complex subunit TusB [Pseudomonas]MDH4762799.1 sulfurtransferase complex subunit TusB [Pseudomonas sp. CBMAI 2609]QNQ99278.1 sulfur relay protein DsrH [Pseudomonas psychrotolerans]
MTTLHLFSRSLLLDAGALDGLSWVGSEDTVLLTGAAVEALRPGSVAAERLARLPAEAALYALAEDVQARRLHPERAVTLIDYPTFVDLSVSCAKVISWT